MIQQLRKKFVLVTMGLLCFVFALALVTLNVIVTKLEINRCLEEMDSLSGTEKAFRFILSPQEEALSDTFSGETPPPLPEESLEDIPPEDESSEERSNREKEGRRMARLAMQEIYMVQLDEQGTVIMNSPLFDFGMEEATFNDLVTAAMASREDRGRTGEFLFLKKSRNYGTLLILRNFAQEKKGMNGILFTSIAIGVLGLGVLFLITLWLSRYVTEPAQKAFTRQKQFIADASHELKTPLSAISVNADVLEREIGENRWLSSIRQETGRMEELVISLLTLARLDAAPQTLQQAFDVSEAVTEIALSFDSLAFEKNLCFTYEVQEELPFTGDPGQIKRLVSILLDNAFAYSPAGEQVHLSLAREEGNVVLSVHNTGVSIDQKDLPHLFERFYRVDGARSGGHSFGLGLAIAQSIAQSHKGTLQVKNTPSGVLFTATFRER